MVRMELVVFRKGRKYGKQMLFPSKRQALNVLKKEKLHPDFKQYSLLRIRPEYYKIKKLKKVI